MEGEACRLVIHSTPANEPQIAHEQLKEDHADGLSCANPKVISLRVSVLRVVRLVTHVFAADLTDNTYIIMMNVT